MVPHTEITRQDLLCLDYDANQPFTVLLADGSTLYCEKVIRIVPQRRVVVFATWNNKPVVAKLLFSQRGLEQFTREVVGIQTLVRNSIPTPTLYFSDTSDDKRFYVLIFERIVNAFSVDTYMHTMVNDMERAVLIETLVMELATQHALGIVQHDLHLKNFLYKKTFDDYENPVLYTLDGAQVEQRQAPLEKKASIENLALLLSQLSITLEDEQEKLFQYYTRLRGWISKDNQIGKLKQIIAYWHRYRWQRYKKKIFRSCSQFAKFKYQHWRGMMERSFQSPTLVQFLHNPEAIFSHPDTVILKAGRSATVVKVTMDSHVLVVKRYNIKNWGHRLCRALRTTRARKSWYMAQKLYFFGIPTAKVVAYIEQRCLGLHGKSYLVMEWVPGVRGDVFFSQSIDVFSIVKSLLLLIVNLAKLKMTHGDWKITNIFINQYQRPLFIDLDGMREHKYMGFLRKKLNKEIQRLLDNFRDQPEIQQVFMRVFAEEMR
ncbi:MAG: hypothetical protein ACD_45C00026G0002 [uncultured bacterium]|nr:MAG: hypothetical protein ACD_45C00026G0002 [uncultured bacterium]OGT47656.1 MAG: hypothetical protein A3E83_07185 [Gammaproteobacteria bacterium RIFCSPHIGHO2_12_FULL_41_20]